MQKQKVYEIEALEEELASYRLMFDNAIVGIGTLHERVITRCNRRFEEIFGYEPGELNDQNVCILYPSVQDFERIGRIGYNYLHTHELYSDERVMKRKNGETFWCNADIKSLDPDHPQRDVVMIFQDISKRKESEEALHLAHANLEHLVEERTRELSAANEALHAEIRLRKEAEAVLLVSREKYRALFEVFPIGISVTNDRGEIIEINQALSKISSRTLLATLMGGDKTTSISLIHEDGTPVARQQLASVRALNEQRTVADVEIGVRYRDSSVRWFSVTAAPIPVKDYGVVVAHVEITERKRIHELDRQRRANFAHVARINTMGTMAATLVHELGQPLSATLNYLHGCQLRLESKEYAPESYHSAISQAICHAEQAAAIIKHLRRQCMRHTEPTIVPVDVNAIIEEMSGFLELERRQQGVTIQLSLCQDLPMVFGDALELEQVMLNLLKNGIEAMSTIEKPHRILKVTTKQGDRRRIEVSVSDRGPGISKKELAHVFTPFFTSKENGVGLGLAICRSIIEDHGGRLIADKNGYGGTTFHFTLPTEE